MVGHTSLRALPPTRHGQGCGNAALDAEHHLSLRHHDKLYDLVGARYTTRTFGALDRYPVQVAQMAPFVETVYVSGWECAATASTTNEPGPDFADYPLNTVPNKGELGVLLLAAGAIASGAHNVTSDTGSPTRMWCPRHQWTNCSELSCSRTAASAKHAFACHPRSVGPHL